MDNYLEENKITISLGQFISMRESITELTKIKEYYVNREINSIYDDCFYIDDEIRRENKINEYVNNTLFNNETKLYMICEIIKRCKSED